MAFFPSISTVTQYCVYRMPRDAEPLPDDLKIPVALANDLLDSIATGTTTHDPSLTQSVEDKDISEAGDMAPNTASILFLAGCEVRYLRLLTTRHLISNLPCKTSPQLVSSMLPGRVGSSVSCTLITVHLHGSRMVVRTIRRERATSPTEQTSPKEILFPPRQVRLFLFRGASETWRLQGSLFRDECIPCRRYSWWLSLRF